MIIDFNADALYFQPLENGVSYALVDNKILSPDFTTHFGFRAKAGFILPHDCFQLSAQFLHFHARTSTEKKGEEFFSLWTFENTPQSEIFNMWRLHLGLADLFLSRSWRVSSCVCLSPFWGLRYGEIRHKLKQDDDVCMKNKFWGVGPEVGFTGNWDLCHWLSLFARSGISLLFGKFYVHQDIETVRFFDEFKQTVNVLEMALGFRLQGPGFFGQAAFEIFVFPSQNQLVRFLDTNAPGVFAANQGTLSMHGLSFGLGINF